MYVDVCVQCVRSDILEVLDVIYLDRNLQRLVGKGTILACLGRAK
jgi:hypothetical protein